MDVVVEVRMSRIKPSVEISMWPVAPEKRYRASPISGVVDEPDGKVLREVLASPHEHREFPLHPIRCLEARVVAPMCSVQSHLPTRRFKNFFRAGD